MSAQRSSQLATTRGDQRDAQSSSMSRRSVVPSLPSLLMDPFGFFDDTPFSLMRTLQSDLNRVLSQPGSSNAPSRRDAGNTAVWVPPIEVEYRDGNFVVSAELPGIPDEDVTVAITDDAVVIQGERQVQRDEDRGGVRRTELRYGQFYRAIPLPDGADSDKATAEFQDGILRITVPISQPQSNTRQIPIQSSGASQSRLTSSSQSQSGQSQSSSDTGTQQTKSTQSSEQKSPPTDTRKAA